MIKRITCAAVLLAAARAHAEPRVGVEMGQTLAGIRGIGARLDLGAVQVEALVGGVLRSTNTFTGPREGSVRAFVPLARWQDGWVGVMAGLDAAQFPDDQGGNNAWAVEAGLHAEWFFLPSLSLGLDLGGVHEHRGPSVPPFPAQSATTSTGVGAVVGETLTFWF